MLWLALLVLAGLATASDLKLGDRIVATEQECDRLYKLSQDWGTASQYMDLYFICVDSLNQDKYAYIHENKVDMSWYPDKHDHFPVETTEGARLVATPPPEKKKDETLKKKVNEYLTKTGGMYDVLYNMMNIQDTMSQEIVNKMVECELIAMYISKHPEDTESQPKHDKCTTELNCLKDEFMENHQFSRDQYEEFFPILYKKRGTMVKTPPKMDKKVCEDNTHDTPEESKSKLEDWMHKIEFIGGKLTDLGEAGSDLIKTLARKGMSGGEKALTTEELDNLLADKDTAANSEEDEDEVEEENPYKMYRDVILGKLGELGGKGFETIQNIGEKLKEFEDTELKDTSKNAFEDIKGGLSLAEIAGKLAASKLTEGADFVNKMLPNIQKDENSDEAKNTSEQEGKTNKNSEDSQSTEHHEKDEETASGGVLKSLIDHIVNPEHLPHIDDDHKPPNLLQIIKDMGAHNKNDDDGVSVEELEETLKDLKHKTKQKAEELQLSTDEIKQSADVVKGVMHVLLNTATEGFGAAKDMSQQEIEKAKSLVDELVNYATAEVLNTKGGNEEDEDGKETSKEKGNADGSQQETKTKGLIVEEVTQNKEVENSAPGERSSQTNSASTENQDTKEPADKRNDKATSEPSKAPSANQDTNQTADETKSKGPSPTNLPSDIVNDDEMEAAMEKTKISEEMRDRAYQEES